MMSILIDLCSILTNFAVSRAHRFSRAFGTESSLIIIENTTVVSPPNVKLGTLGSF